MFGIIGDGIQDENKNSSHKEYDKIENIYREKVISEKDECFNMWVGQSKAAIYFPIYLQYRINPLQKFFFQINENSKGY